MSIHLSTIEGNTPVGMAVGRERLRWAAAEARWHGSSPIPPWRPPPPQTPKRNALKGGALLDLFIQADAKRNADAQDRRKGRR